MHISLDGARLRDDDSWPEGAEAITLLVQPLLDGGAAAPIPPGRYRFGTIDWDGTAIRLDITPR